jgi:hypothetical protein
MYIYIFKYINLCIYVYIQAPSDPDSLANLIAVSQHLERTPEVVNRYLSQLKTKAPNHALLTSLATFEGAFDRVSASLKV